MMIGRLVHKADFERVLACSPRSRSAHFAVYHVGDKPSAPGRAPEKARSEELSTGAEQARIEIVDNFGCRHWLGTVIPKRHARRAVTRNLLRRQARRAMELHGDRLAPGLWVVRLRQPFAKEQFPSAASAALRAAARDELDRLLGRAGLVGPGSP